MIKTVIECPCGGKFGDYIGDVAEGDIKSHLMKCLNCKQQLKIKHGDGLNFA